jgi:hypothetical protein
MNSENRIFEASNAHMTSSDEHRKKQAALMAHILIWLLIFLVPFLFDTGNRERSLGMYLMFSIPMFFNMTVFYLNYSFLIERFLFKREIWTYLLINLLIFLLVGWIVMLFQTVWIEPLAGLDPLKRPDIPVKFIWARTIVSLLMVSGLSVAIRMTSQWYLAERIRTQLEKARVESELSNLKNQLSPHFFFNTLNNIYSLIAIRPVDAQKAVHQLSKLIRYILYESDHEQVPLKSELAFVRSYIELMALRYPQHVTIDTEIIDPTGNPVIAPLLFISLIENAFKHGSSPVEGSVIRIRIAVTGEGDEEKVECRTENGYFPKDGEDKSGSGIGLENLRKRLELIYPGRYTLDQQIRDGIFVSHLSLKP